MLQWESKQHKCWPLATHASISSTTATVTTSCLGHHNVKSLQLQASRVTIAIYSNSRNLFVYTRAADNVNTTLTYQLQSGQVPGQGANTGPRLQSHAVQNHPVFQCISYDKLIKVGLVPRLSYHGRRRKTGRQNMRGGAFSFSYDMRAWGQG